MEISPFKRFESRFERISGEVLSLVAQIDELKGQWTAGARLAPQTLGRLKRSVLITSSGASTRIEGSRLSDEDVEKLIQGVRIQKFADRDKQEVQGYYELLENVFSAWESLSFNENLIQHFHQELLKYVEKDQEHSGRYKKQENKVHAVSEAGETLEVIFDTTPAYLTPKEMQELVSWTRQALERKNPHPLLVVGNFVVEFLKIHPFQDGNGRLSRILSNFLLLKSGYAYTPYISHEKFVEDNKTDYYLALRRTQKTLNASPDISPWLLFFLGIFLRQSQMALALLSGEEIEKQLSQKQLAVWRYLQQAHEASPGLISQQTKVPQPTVVQALQKLMKLQRIERLGQGRSTRYRLKP